MRLVCVVVKLYHQRLGDFPGRQTKNKCWPATLCKYDCSIDTKAATSNITLSRAQSNKHAIIAPTEHCIDLGDYGLGRKDSPQAKMTVISKLCSIHLNPNPNPKHAGFLTPERIGTCPRRLNSSRPSRPHLDLWLPSSVTVQVRLGNWRPPDGAKCRQNRPWTVWSNCIRRHHI